MKKPRKVALIDVRDCPRCDFDAYWQITVIEPPAGETEYAWRAKILSYQPIGYLVDGASVSLAEAEKLWPGGVPRPQYPSDTHLLRQAAFDKLLADALGKGERAESDARALQVAELARQDEYRARCAAAHAAAPQPLHLVEETIGVAPDKDAADTAAQEWVREKMKAQRKGKPGGTLHSFAGALPLDPLGDAVREIFDQVRYGWRKHVRPLLMAISYSTTIRNNKQQQTINAIDAGAGAGLLRIYDGSRPASCGTATTLGAELTFSDPCAPAPSGGVLTASAITPDASANASITATWFRAVDSTGTCCIDGNVGTSGSDMNVNSTTIASGVQVACGSFVITGANA